MMLYLACVGIALLAYAGGQLTEEERQIFIDNGVTITDDTDDPDTYWVFSHTGIPSHDHDTVVNEATEQNHEYKIAKVPAVLETPECLSLGTIAAAINGVPYYNPYSALGYNAVEGDNAESFDQCQGHADDRGSYHYHQIPNCVYNSTSDDQLYGVALDGHPIYGPHSNSATLTSADLDDCHGQTRNGRYEYRITYDFPYVVGCFKGQSSVTSGPPTRKKRQMPPPGSNQGGSNMLGPDACLYVTYCENPTVSYNEVCPEAAIVYGGSTDTDATTGDNSSSTGTSAVLSLMGTFLLCGYALVSVLVM